jgi:hypothetical protein
MKAVHITNHIGTTRNMENVFDFLHISDRLHTEQCDFPTYIHLTRADHIFQLYKPSDFFHKYNTLIFTDISMYARPFLQNIEDHSMNIIVYITNRFDWGAWYNGDTNYNQLYSTVSNHPRVRFVSDNRYDMYYAADIHNIHFFLDDIIRLTPKIVPFNKNKVCFHNGKLFIYNRGTFIRHYHSYLEVDYDVYGYDGYSRYKDEDHIAEYMGYLHLPYQTNIQSLWENLGHQIIYFIPSKTFLISLLSENWYHWEEKCNKPKHMIDISVELAEWYQPENECLFVLFDSWTDLTDKFYYYLNNNDAVIHKKKKIYDYLLKSNTNQLYKWQSVFYSFRS